MQNQYLIS